MLSETDVLTGLANARGLFDRLEAELARSRRYHEPLALLLVDLDGLKRINDRHGHHAGDEAIRSLAAVIRFQLRESDVGARWGGDEFAVLAPNTSEHDAVALAAREGRGAGRGARSWRGPLRGGWPVGEKFAGLREIPQRAGSDAPDARAAPAAGRPGA